MEELIPIVAIAFTFGIPGIIIFWYLYNRHNERMRLIEKGLSAEEVKQYFSGTNGRRNPYSTLKWGLLLTFIGLGFFISYILTELTDMSDQITPAFILFFGGAAFITYFLIINRKLKDQSPNNGENK